LPDEPDVGDGIAVQLQAKRDLIAAQGIVTAAFPVVWLREPVIPGVLAVIEDHFLVELAEVHQPNNSCTF
jgi:hypothetical protein